MSITAFLCCSIIYLLAHLFVSILQGWIRDLPKGVADHCKCRVQAYNRHLGWSRQHSVGSEPLVGIIINNFVDRDQHVNHYTTSRPIQSTKQTQQNIYWSVKCYLPTVCNEIVLERHMCVVPESSSWYLSESQYRNPAGKMVAERTDGQWTILIRSRHSTAEPISPPCHHAVAS